MLLLSYIQNIGIENNANDCCWSLLITNCGSCLTGIISKYEEENERLCARYEQLSKRKSLSLSLSANTSQNKISVCNHRTTELSAFWERLLVRFWTMVPTRTSRQMIEDHIRVQKTRSVIFVGCHTTYHFSQIV